MVTIIKFYFTLILYLVNFDLVISDDELYKKFFQNDYKADFERAEVTYVNKSYGEFTVYPFKYNRTHFATNMTILLNVDMGYDLEIIVQAYKFLSNEYRLFPIHFEINACKLLKYNIVGSRTCVAKCGYLSCPLKKNVQYSICNCLFDESKMPPLIPSGRYKLALEEIYKDVVVSRTETYINIYRPFPTGKRFG